MERSPDGQPSFVRKLFLSAHCFHDIEPSPLVSFVFLSFRALVTRYARYVLRQQRVVIQPLHPATGSDQRRSWRAQGTPGDQVGLLRDDGARISVRAADTFVMLGSQVAECPWPPKGKLKRSEFKMVSRTPCRA